MVPVVLYPAADVRSGDPVSKCLYQLEQGGKMSTGLGTAWLSPGAEVSAWTPQAVFKLKLADGGMAE